MNGETDKLTSSQQSVFYWSEEDSEDSKLRERPNYYHLSNTTMLIEDVANSIVPVPGYSKKDYSFRLEPTDDQAEEIVARALKHERYRSDLTDAGYDFFQQCSSTMMAYGRADYEMVYLSDAGGRALSFRLVLIQPLTLEFKGKRLLQYVPKRICVERGISTQYVELNAENVLTFELPQYMRDNYRHMMESLAFMSVNFMPTFTQTNLRGETKIPFDFTEFSRTHKLALAQATTEIGWHGRQLFREEILEYYFFYRDLLFEKFKAEMRGTILKTLNAGIERAATKIGFQGSLEIEGLPTMKEVQSALEGLEAGDTSFEKVMKPFLNS